MVARRSRVWRPLSARFTGEEGQTNLVNAQVQNALTAPCNRPRTLHYHLVPVRGRDTPIEIHDTSIAEPSPAGAVIDPIGPPPRIDPQEGRIRSGKLAGLSMWHAIWVLSWPVLIESLLNSLVGVVDTTLAAGVSEAATDAIGGAAYFMWFVGLIAIALGVGATAMISRAMGRGRLAIASVVVGQCATLSVVSGVMIGLFIALIAPVIATWLHLGLEAHAECVLYIRLCALAVPLQTFAQVGMSCCRGAGDSVRPMVLMIVINVLNLVVSFLLSGVDVSTGRIGPDGVVVRRVWIENPSPMNLGVAGIALGTAIAWSIGGLMMCGMLVRGVHGIRLFARRLRPHAHTIIRLVAIGLPSLSETFAMWLGNFLVIVLVGWLEDPGLLGANVLTVRIEAFSFLPGFAMSLAAGTLAGTYLGAGSPAMARRAVLRCLGIAAAMMGVCGVGFMLVPGRIAGLFTQQEAHLEIVPRLLAIAGLIQAVFAVSIVLRGALRGSGATRAVMWITWIAIWGVRLPLAWLGCGVDVPLPFGWSIPNPAPLRTLGVHPLEGMWIGLCVEILIRSALFGIAFLKGDWMKQKV